MSQIQTVAYVMQIFPFRTETFISREVEALRASGIEVITLSNQMPGLESLETATHALCSTTYYVFPLTIVRLMQILLAHIWWLVRHPPTYSRCIRLLMQEESKDRSIWLRNIKHFLGAPYLAYMIRNRNIQHIHAHYAINASTMALVIAILLDIPFSMTIHNIIFTDRTLMRVKLEQAEAIVCISDYSRNAILREYQNIPNLDKKMSIVHCGIHVDDFKVTRASEREPSIFTIMTACQLTERKGVQYLIEACYHLFQAGQKFRCIIAGDGEEREMLEKQVRDYHIEHVVEFVGTYTQQEMKEYFAKSDVFILPCAVAENGDRDGIPIVLMEAMASGIPVISTLVSGIPELIMDGQNGHLVEEKNAVALAMVVQKYMNHEVDLDNQVIKARATIVDEFNMQKSITRLSSLFFHQMAD